MHKGLSGTSRKSIEGGNSKKMCTQSPRESIRHFFLETGFQRILHNAQVEKIETLRIVGLTLVVGFNIRV